MEQAGVRSEKQILALSEQALEKLWPLDQPLSSILVTVSELRAREPEEE
jgi:hypothetical protein